MASANFLDNFCKVVSSVKYLSIETEKHPFKRDAFPKELIEAVRPEAVFVKTAVRPIEAFKYLFNKDSYNIDRFYSDSFKTKIEETLSSEPFDLIVLDGLYTTPYLKSIRSVFQGKVMVRTHNVEHKIWEGLSENESNPIKKKYLSKLAKDLKNYEIETLNKVDGIATLSQDDLNDCNDLKISAPKAMIPISTEIQDNNHDYSNANLFHLGAMNWQPNIEAVEYVVDLMPEIRMKQPNMEFHIAGIDS